MLNPELTADSKLVRHGHDTHKNFFDRRSIDVSNHVPGVSPPNRHINSQCSQFLPGGASTDRLMGRDKCIFRIYLNPKDRIVYHVKDKIQYVRSARTPPEYETE